MFLSRANYFSKYTIDFCWHHPSKSNVKGQARSSPSRFSLKLKTSSSLSPGIISHSCPLLLATPRLCVLRREKKGKGVEVGRQTRAVFKHGSSWLYTVFVTGAMWRVCIIETKTPAATKHPEHRLSSLICAAVTQHLWGEWFVDTESLRIRDKNGL